MQPEDFKETVSDLKKRARRAHMFSGLAMLVFAASVVVVVAFGTRTVYGIGPILGLATSYAGIDGGRTSDPASIPESLKKKLVSDFDTSASISEAFAKNKAVVDFLTSREDKNDEYIAEINARQQHPNENYTILRDIFYSVGIVGLLLYFVQIMLQFIRYYAQLAELYSSQASAMIASQGDPELNKKYNETFSPLVVKLGKSPTTPVEKALDVLRDAGWYKAKPSNQE